jgi:hypothetical protein
MVVDGATLALADIAQEAARDNVHADRIAGAVHEAAHAVAATAVGYKVYRVVVDEVGCGEARYRWPRWDGPASPSGLWRRLMVTFAGPVAERLAFYGASEHEAAAMIVEDFTERRNSEDEYAELIRESGEFDDMAVALASLHGYQGDHVAEVREAAEDVAEILIRHWGDVLAVAQHVLDVPAGVQSAAAVDYLQTIARTDPPPPDHGKAA